MNGLYSRLHSFELMRISARSRGNWAPVFGDHGSLVTLWRSWIPNNNMVETALADEARRCSSRFAHSGAWRRDA
jgi:hypothetical protein